MESLAFATSYVGLWLLVLFQTVLLLALTRNLYSRDPAQSARSEQRDTTLAPRIGDGAAAFRTVDAFTGSTVTEEIFAGKFTALLFVSPHCASCMTTLDELNALRHKARGNVVLVCGGNQEECARVVRRFEGLTLPTLIDSDNAIRNAYRVPGTPYAVLVNEVGKIEFSGQPQRHGEVEELLERADPLTVSTVGD